MTDIVTRLKADVATQTSIIGSCNTLLQGLAQRIRDANDNGDEVELNNIADEIEQNTTTLSQAVVANTIADPATTASDTTSQDTTQQDTTQQDTTGEAVQPTDQTNDQSGHDQSGQ